MLFTLRLLTGVENGKWSYKFAWHLPMIHQNCSINDGSKMKMKLLSRVRDIIYWFYYRLLPLCAITTIIKFHLLLGDLQYFPCSNLHQCRMLPHGPVGMYAQSLCINMTEKHGMEIPHHLNHLLSCFPASLLVGRHHRAIIQTSQLCRRESFRTVL